MSGLRESNIEVSCPGCENNITLHGDNSREKNQGTGGCAEWTLVLVGIATIGFYGLGLVLILVGLGFIFYEAFVTILFNIGLSKETVGKIVDLFPRREFKCTFCDATIRVNHSRFIVDAPDDQSFDI